MANYQLKMTRVHSTAVTVSEFRSSTGRYEIPLRQHTVAEFSSDGDVFTLSPEEVTALALPSVAVHAEPDHPAEGWGEWQPEMLREVYEFPLPAVLGIAPKSPAGELMEFSLTTYESLYGDDEFAPYRVLEHWFCTIGCGLNWTSKGLLSDGQSAKQRAAEKERSNQRKAARMAQGETEPSSEEREMLCWSQSVLVSPPVGLYPLSDGYSNIFDVPENVEDSFLVAAFSMLRYLLGRPVWENSAYSPADLVGDRSSKASQEVWNGEQWRYIALADGAKYRTLLEQAYTRLVLGTWGLRLKTMGFEDKSFYPLDYRLPPQAKRYPRVPAVNPPAV